MAANFSKKFPRVAEVTALLDAFFSNEYPDFFGSSPLHPIAQLKRSKVIHDNLWGTNDFNWRELAVIDSPIFQRLRNIHQTGLAYFVYPCAHHTRFEHSLGVCIMASRVFDAFERQHRTRFQTIAKTVDPKIKDPSETLAQWRAELRLAALLHDTGHSLHSHTSEIVYSQIPLLAEAAKELSRMAGTSKGVGEVLSFCISCTNAMRNFLARTEDKLMPSEESDVQVDLDNVSLLIIGRAKHPQLQFLGDIISSHLDADKLDYLLRDATAAGLPLRYDLERYLYTVDFVDQKLADGEGFLQELYSAAGSTPERNAPLENFPYPFYNSFKLHLPRQAMNTIEQIIICKFMLFSYIYHHKKVRAAEGMLARLIRRGVSSWRAEGMTDADLIERFLKLTDHALDGDIFSLKDDDISDYRERVTNRVLPREVVGFTASIKHPESAKVSAFMAELLKREKTKELVKRFEEALAVELHRQLPSLSPEHEAILTKTGTWFDVPKIPTFDKLEDLLVEATSVTDIFPVTSWIQAYISYRYNVRVFAFSEYVPQVEQAARYACKVVLGINDPNFVDAVKTSRES